MVNKTFFDNPPSSDKRLGSYGVWQNPPGTFRNGYFQHITWLGVSGYVIVNHFAPREILLVDPWPSYRRSDLLRETKSPRERLLYLASWLRDRAAEGYRLTGILVTHEHFDHVDDIPTLLEMLHMPGNVRMSLNNLRHPISFSSPGLSLDALPTIFADKLSMDAVRKENDAQDALLKFSEIRQADGRSGVNYLSLDRAACPPCGTALQSVNAGNFEITPYVWDHMNLSTRDQGLFGSAGNRHKISAFSIRWKPVADAKRTFILGSAGEMNAKYTHHGIAPLPTPIETDTLIQAITSPSTPEYENQLAACVAYQVQSVRVHDYVIPSHWEDFFFGPPKPARNSRGFYKNHERVDAYRSAWKRHLEHEGRPQGIVEAELAKLVSLRRVRFEYNGIPNCCDMTWP